MKPVLFRIGVWSIAWFGLGVASVSWCQVYPSKPVRLIVGGAPGGGAEVVARPLAQKLSEAFGQQVVVDARSGGGGVISAQLARASPPDGYTMYLGNAAAMSIAPAVRKELSFDPVRDFSPVTLVATTPLLVAVHPSLSVKSLKELIALAKAKPKQLLVASNGEGTMQHLTIEMFGRAANVSFLHIPYKGGTPAVIDTVAGQTQAIITAAPTVLAQVRSSRLRALAVTSSERAAGLQDIPTVAESGWSGFEAVQWYGIFAPTGTPAPVIEVWFRETSKALESPNVKTMLAQEAAVPAANGPQALAEFHRIDMAKWQKVARESNIALK